MKYIVNQFKTISDEPDRYVLEFQDLLSHYLGQILPLPTIIEKSGHMSEVDFVLIDEEENLSEEEIEKYDERLIKAYYHAVEKEAAAIVEALRQWRHFLLGRQFKIITDQKSISYMYDNKRKSKIKNDKIARWRVELSQFKFDIVYRPGKENVAADNAWLKSAGWGEI